MDFDIMYLNSNKNSPTKNLILKLLTINSSLSINQIQSSLRKEFNKKVSYQGIRQLLLELVESEILEKNEKVFQIRKDWVEKIKLEVSLLEKSIEQRNKIKVIDKQTTQVTLKNLYELGHFILYSLEQKYFDISENSETLMVLDHLWIPFSDESKRNRLKTFLSNFDFKVYVNANSMIDKMLAKWYKKFVSVNINSPHNFPCDYIVHGDLVVQIYFDEKLKEKMNQFYKLKALMNSNVFNELSDMTYEENPIQIIITKNQTISNQIKTQILKTK